MKIVVNTRLLIHNKLEGIGWFSFETLKRMAIEHPNVDFVFVFDRPYHPDFIFSSNVTPVVIGPPARHPFLFYIWFEYSMKRVIAQHKPDLFLSPDGYLSLSSSVRQLAVIHDINFEHYPKQLPWLHSKYYRYFFPRFAKKATRIATVSEYSKQDIASTYGVNADRIDVVYNGSNELYKPLSESEKIKTKQEFTNGCEYFIYIGALLPRKNIARLLMAFDAFKKATNSSTKLVIVGAKMFHTDDIENTYHRMQHLQDVVFTGRLNPDRLHLVLGSALALTFVPYFEGFGIPLLEAMHSEVPLITSNRTALPEVAGDAAYYVDPFSVQSITDGLIAIATNEPLRNDLIAKGRLQRQQFSWDATAQKLWSSIEACFK